MDDQKDGLITEPPTIVGDAPLAAGRDLTGVPLRGAAEIVDTVFATMKSALVAGESVKLVQFGVLAVRDKSPRRGRNPKTGASMIITKRQMVTFRPSRRLRDLMNR